MSYASDRHWADQFLPTMRAVIGPYLLTAAPFELDAKQVTDLIVLKARDLRIACRMRRPGYAAQYPTQVTIRSERTSGVETELDKIVAGWGDWMFYGHAVSNDSCIIDPWFLIDLHAFRAHLILHPKLVWPETVTNRDGTSFVAYDLALFPAVPAILVASSRPVLAQQLMQKESAA